MSGADVLPGVPPVRRGGPPGVHSARLPRVGPLGVVPRGIPRDGVPGQRLVAAVAGKVAVAPPPQTGVRGSVGGSVSRGVDCCFGKPQGYLSTRARGDALVRYYKRCLGRCFPCFQLCDFRLHPKGYHSLLGGFGVDLELKSRFSSLGEVRTASGLTACRPSVVYHSSCYRTK